MTAVLDKAASAALVAMYPEGVALSLVENGRVIVSPEMFERGREVVRAVFRALHAPTEEMLHAMQASLDCTPINRCEQQATQVWQNTIDAILEGRV